MLSVSSLATASSDYQSNYAGQEAREIKTLSAEDIAALKAGKGWGLAKAAELNGVPGPRHLLQMKDELGLNEDQVENITLLFKNMQAKAIELGHLLILSERRLNNAFYFGHINKIRLKKILDVNQMLRKKLRFVHLNTHLDTLKYVTRDQVSLYNQLRGYADAQDSGTDEDSGDSSMSSHVHH